MSILFLSTVGARHVMFCGLATLGTLFSNMSRVDAQVAPAPAETTVETGQLASVSANGIVLASAPVLVKPDSEIAKAASEAMQGDFELEGDFKLPEMSLMLTQNTGVPFWLDERAIKFAELDLATQWVNFDPAQEPLTTSLRRVLNPIGLKAVIQDEGIFITADRVALARKGIGASKWLGIDEEAAKKINLALDQKTSANFVEETLLNAMASLSDRHGVSIVIDGQALEELGINSDVPVSCSLTDVKLRTVIEAILSDLDLALSIKGEVLEVTTTEAAEARPLTRIYLLSGTGFPKGDATDAIETIQTTIQCDTWEALGGPSTMRQMLIGEQASVIVSTTYRVHKEIEMLLTGLRESTFGEDPVLEKETE